MKFKCYECGKHKRVQHRVFEHVDWCRGCALDAGIRDALARAAVARREGTQ